MRTRLRGKFSLLFLMLAVLLAVPAVAAFAQDTGTSAAPTIHSDKEDYKPGELVTLTGGGWQAGELVNIKVNDTYGASWARNVDVTADASGQITDSFNLPDWFVSDYNVTATGAQSGAATTTFTDGNINVDPNRVPTSGFQTVARGTSYDFTVNHTKQGGGPDPKVNAPIQVTNVAGTNKVTPTCGTAGTIGTVGTTIPTSWLSVVSPTLPQTIGDSSNTDINFRVSPPANAASGTYTGAVNLTTTDGGAETFDLCLTVPATVNTTTTASNASATYGGSSVTLNANVTPASGSAVNTGTVTFTVKNGAGTTLGTATSGTVSGGSASASFPLSGVNAAKYTIDAAYNAGTGFNASNNSTQSPKPELTVGKKELTVTAANKQITYGDPEPSFGFAYSGGFVGTDTAAGIDTAPTCGVTGAHTNAGSYAIVCSGGVDNNYSFKYVDGTLSIAKAAGSVSIDNPPNNAVFGGSFTPTYTKAGDGQTSLESLTEATCTVSSAGVVNFVGAGTCKLQASVAEGTNHLAATNQQSFEIAKAQANLAFDLSTLPAKTFGDADFSVASYVDSDSDGDEHFALGTGSVGCTVTDSGTVSITGAATGTDSCVIKVTQDSSANYMAAGPVSDSLTIAKAQATLILSGLTGLTYNGQPQGATVTTTVNNNPVNLSGVSVTYNGSTTVPTNAGSYTVVASLDNPNYQATSATGTLVIGKKSLTVTAEDKQSTYGDASLPANSVTYTDGFVNNEDPSDLGGTLSYKYYQNGNEVASPTNAGAYAIRPGGLTSGNYQISFVDGTLTIDQRSVTASITAADKPYDGNTNATITGCSLDAASGNTGALANDDVDCSATNAHFDSASAGNKTVSADVSLTGTDKGNYKLTSNTASTSAEIDKVELTVKADNKSKTYDGDPFTNFTSQITGFVNNETQSVISGLPVTYNGTAVGAAGAGQYTITPDVSGLSATNYTFKAENGTLTIGKAQGSVSINNPPANAVLNGSFTPSYTKAGDGATSVSSLTSATCTVNSGVVSFVGAGVCTLQASVAEGTNHFAATGSQQSFNVGYKFVGFAAPVDNLSYMNVLKAGQAIPLKWRLLDANDQPVANLAGVTVTVKTLSCTQGATLDQLEEVAAGGSGLQNLGSGYYQYNWKSPTSYANSCKTLHLDLGEGKDASGNPVTRQASFKFTK